MVTNGREAELLETRTGRVLDSGTSAIPPRTRLVDMARELAFEPFADEEKREREARILHVFDEEVCCRGGVCQLPPGDTGD